MIVGGGRRIGIEPAVAALATAPLLALRLHHAEPGLLYPDGYQYLLMAKGIAAHGRPLLTLGRDGDTLLPSADAAAKPLYPALIAVVHACGVAWFTAARVVTAVAAALTVVLTGLVARRLTGSWLAALAAAGACLASREQTFWTGFAGPDPLGDVLALAGGLALLRQRPRLGGLLLALAALARPEVALLVSAAAVAAWRRPDLRLFVHRASTAFVGSLAVLLALLRPPLEPPSRGTLVLAAMGTAAAAIAAVIATRVDRRRLGSVVVAVVILTPLVATVGGAADGLRRWAATDWPLLVAASLGSAVATRVPRLRIAAAMLVVAIGVLAIAYALKNPVSDRYPSMLTPLLALLISLAVGDPSPRRRRVALAAVAVLFAISLSQPRLPARAPDAFPAVARQLQALRLPRLPLVTSAPDAYGVLLPRRSIRVARSGSFGLVILDGAQRTYEPHLRVSGRTLATLDPGSGFVRPDGTMDRRPVRVVLGTVLDAKRTLFASAK